MRSAKSPSDPQDICLLKPSIRRDPAASESNPDSCWTHTKWVMSPDACPVPLQLQFKPVTFVLPRVAFYLCASAFHTLFCLPFTIFSSQAWTHQILSSILDGQHFQEACLLSSRFPRPSMGCLKHGDQFQTQLHVWLFSTSVSVKCHNENVLQNET